MPKKAPPPDTLRDHYAGFISRVLSLIIDGLILALVLAVSSVLWNLFVTNFNAFLELISGRTIDAPVASIFASVIAIYMFSAIYFIFLWSAVGTTIGGVIIGIKLVNKHGRRPSFWRCCVRFITEFTIPIFGFIAALWIVFSHRRRALYDRMAGTFVVYAWDARPDEKFLRATTEQLEGVKQQ
jgi:uncharacterized RDD family membrane protein YckC